MVILPSGHWVVVTGLSLLIGAVCFSSGMDVPNAAAERDDLAPHEWKSVPQRLKPSSAQTITARLKPVPFVQQSLPQPLWWCPIWSTEKSNLDRYDFHTLLLCDGAMEKRDGRGRYPSNNSSKHKRLLSVRSLGFPPGRPLGGAEFVQAIEGSMKRRLAPRK